jgi:transcriptional regulator with XRE-family HTH domain
MKLLNKQDERAVADAVGARIKEARGAAGLTLKALSQATGLSQPFLSRLERGLVSASIANLLQIGRALGLSMADLLEGEARGPAPGWVVHRGGPPIAADGYSFRQLAPDLRGRRMDAFVLDFSPGQGMDLVVAHEGEELLYVLEGRIRFVFGEEEALLAAGDAVQFDSSLPHTAQNAGARPARLLMVTAPGRGEPFGWQRALADAANKRQPSKRRTRP